MNESDLEKTAAELKALYEEDCRTPFPYEGSRKLLQAEGGNYESFIPDLSLYFSTVAGYCSWGKRILRWEPAKINEAKVDLEKQFFDKHPAYKPLERKSNRGQACDLRFWSKIKSGSGLRFAILIFEFQTPRVGLASPINRTNPGFVGLGKTLGGAREFVIPNGPIPANATVRIVGP
jgi:hypothetical protein